MSDSASAYTLYISDEAFQQLETQARMLGYVSSDTARGMHKFIEFLMTCSMSDARPDEIRDTPEWHLYAPRFRRRFKLSERTLTRSAAHCLALGIAYHPSQRIRNAPTCLDFVRCISALLEAIGTEWVSVRTQDD